MKEYFLYWTSGNKKIDELIRYTQLTATKTFLWMEGPRWIWDDGAQEWTRTGPMNVALKRLDNSQNISSSYIKQIKSYHKCLQSVSLTFGITKDLESIYMIVMKYYENGDLYQYLDHYNGILSWRDMIDMLWGIAGGLERIHGEGKIHGNLHGGNLLIEDEDTSTDARIGDIGLHGPCNNENKSSDQIYGVLPYVAPEVLRGENYSTASDMYSIGIIINTLATAKDICNGERFEIPEDTPNFYSELMQQCEWIILICDDPTPSKISDENSIAEEKRWKMISQLSKKITHPEIHPEACE
uniref:Protein kinase domain-containing protein n=1 Tax=Rhizophagus irregularis (strain DAOM 181602 / DAOM 197198 / MUCL 43194) TaxID=747089 RepID=U9SVC0_RHIID